MSDSKTVERLLNKIISISLWETKGGPTHKQTADAYEAYQELKQLRLEVEDEEDVMAALGINVF